MNNDNSLFTRISSWLSESILLKLVVIGVLTLIFLIPSVLIQDLIQERQQRQREVVSEVSDKWGGKQQFSGPVMVLPYKTTVKSKSESGVETAEEVLQNIYLLPDNLQISGSASPEVLHRGIFDVVVYNADLQVSGKFTELEISRSGIVPQNILWEKARVVIGLSDLKGLKSNPKIRLADQVYDVEPDFNASDLFSNNLILQANLSDKKSAALDFSFKLEIRGAENLDFLHTGKKTSISMSSSWGNPSFTGRFLPDDRKVNKEGFTAQWNMLAFNRPFPQQWIGNGEIFSKKSAEALVGVNFLLPVDQYQQSIRSAKYGTLIILLSFVALLFTEIITKKKIHIIQYILIGAAMTIYYTLLLSFSEHIGFDAAYLTASAATVILIGSFIGALVRKLKTALVFSGILVLFYGFIFVIIQLQDLALLFGSIGLFVIIATLMYFSSKLDWVTGISSAESENN